MPGGEGAVFELSIQGAAGPNNVSFSRRRRRRLEQNEEGGVQRAPGCAPGDRHLPILSLSRAFKGRLLGDKVRGGEEDLEDLGGSWRQRGRAAMSRSWGARG